MAFRFLALLCVIPLLAQTQGGTVPATEASGGRVLDDQKKPLPGATVTYRGKDGKAMEPVKSGADGQFSVKVPAGDYDVKVEADGFVPRVLPLGKGDARALGDVQMRKSPATLVEAKVRVLNPDRKAATEAKITFKGKSGQVSAVAAGKDGEYQAQLPPDSPYDVTVEAPGHPPVMLQTPKEGLELITVVLGEKPKCCEPRFPVIWVVTICLICYWLIAMLARFHNIVRVDRELIHGSIVTTRQEVRIADDKHPANVLIKNAEEFLERAKNGPMTFLFGFRGQEAAARASLCDVRLILAETYSRDQIAASLRITVESLRPEYASLATKVEAALAKINDADAPTTDFLRATLITALRCAHEKAEVAALGMMNWQNKAFALVTMGCCFLLAMAWGLDHSVLLLMGLIGGFASRLMRGKTDASSDGSLRWTTLLLSPLYGAFAGWAGVLLVTILASTKLLGEAFSSLTWEQASCSSMALGLAFVFGFSERAFSAVTDMAESAISKQKNASAADGPATKQTASDPKAGIPTASTATSVLSASWDAGKLLVTLTGKNLKAVAAVKLKPSAGAEIALAIDTSTQTDEKIEAKAAAAPAAGTYAVLVDGKASGTVTVG